MRFLSVTFLFVSSIHYCYQQYNNRPYYGQENSPYYGQGNSPYYGQGNSQYYGLGQPYFGSGQYSGQVPYGSSAGDYSSVVIPQSVFNRLGSNNDEPTFLFTRIDPLYGAIIPPNLIFHVDYPTGNPVPPYLLTSYSSSVIQSYVQDLVNALNSYSTPTKQYEYVYLLSEVNTTTGMPIPPYLLFHADSASRQAVPPYVLSRLDLNTGGPTTPELLQQLNSETGYNIVRLLLPVLNDYIDQGY